MTKHLLFIQGGDEGGYQTDKKLVTSLQTALGKEYEIHYPELTSDESAPDFGWMQQISEHISQTQGDLILAGHSLGASMLVKCLSENAVPQKIHAVFLLAAPFWEGNEDWKQGLKLQDDFAGKLPNQLPIFFYQCQDDEVVSFSHLGRYQQKLPQATFCELKSGGHQFTDGLTVVANDIRSL